MDLSVPSIETGSPAVEQTLNKLRASQAGLDALVVELFNELKSLHGELTQGRRTAREQNEQAERQIEQLTESLDAARSRLAEVEAELAAALEEAAAREAARADEPAVDESAQRERDELLVERDALESQLETVRDRAADLVERLEREQREFAEERRQLQNELSRLNRSLVERPAAQPAPPDGARATVPMSAVKSEVQENPVIDSVMAQFQMVQRDAARRRNNAANRE
jgi:chromosome segregation ATPase